MDVLDFAKILNETGNACGLTPQDYEQEISKRAEATRSAGETREQAFTRYATTTEDGRLLFKAAVKGPAPKPAVQDLTPPRPMSAGEASDELNELAAAVSRRKGISREIAYTELWSDPERRELVRRVRQEERDLQNRIAR